MQVRGQGKRPGVGGAKLCLMGTGRGRGGAPCSTQGGRRSTHMLFRLPVAPVMTPPLQVTPLKAQNLLATVFAVTSVSRRGNSSTHRRLRPQLSRPTTEGRERKGCTHWRVRTGASHTHAHALTCICHGHTRPCAYLGGRPLQPCLLLGSRPAHVRKWKGGP